MTILKKLKAISVIKNEQFELTLFANLTWREKNWFVLKDCKR